MSGNSNPKLAITSDLRTKVIQKFTLLHSKLQTNVTPEQLEKSCYDKANNDQEAYLRLCNNLVANRTKQLEIKGNIVSTNQVRTVMNSNFRPNIVGQINSIEPDPINALTNLTVTAGQPNQITMQPGHQQINYRINSTPQPSIMQLNTINPQMGHQRLMVSGNNIRQLDQFGMSQQPQHQMSPSPNPQLMSNQIPNAQMQVHTIGQVNTGNPGNTIRIINKGSTMKPEQMISANQPMQSSPYQIDGNGGPIVNQHMSQVMHGSVSRSPGMRMVSNSPRMVTQHQSPQEHYPMAGQIINSTPVSINTQPEEPQQAPSQPASSVASQPAPTSSIKSPLSEQETAQVKDEMSKLSAKYYKSLSLAVENPMNTSVETLKVWSVLRDLLDTTKPCNKPISMKHVAKIKLYSEKAEEHVKLHQLDPTKTPRRTGPTASASASTTPGAAPISGSDAANVGNKGGCTVNSDGEPSGGQNQAQTLDSAFDKVIADINNQDIRHKRKARDSLINHIKTKSPQFLYMLPKYLHPTEPEGMDTSDAKFDEHEFDFIQHLPVEGMDVEMLPPVSHRAFDNDGLLRMDIDAAPGVAESTADLAGELVLLSREFDIVSIDRQTRGPDWAGTDADVDWDRNSLFYTVKVRQQAGRELPTEVPPISVRVPEDYEHSLSVDWNINVPLYPAPNCTGTSEAEVFLLDVLVALQDELAQLAQSPWTNVPFLNILSIYKRCIHAGYSSYQVRNMFPWPGNQYL